MKERSPREIDLTTTVNNPGVTLQVRTHVSTGADPKTRPGVGFDLIYSPEAHPVMVGNRLTFGVVDRDQIRALRNALTDFLLDYPDGTP